MKIFDMHTHTYPELLAARASSNLGKFYNFTVDHDGTIADLMRTSAEGGVSGFLILGVATKANQVRHVNESLASDITLAKEHGFQAFGFAAMHQDQDTESFEEELNAALSSGLCGVKLHPDIQHVTIDDERLYPLYDMLEERSLPLYLHMGDDRPEYRYSEPQRLRRIHELFPNLTVGASHFGGYKAWDDAVTYLKGVENIFFDASSTLWVMTPEFARHMIDKLGAENIMFGTDYPVTTAKEYLELFDRVKMTDKEREMILWDNAANFFNLNDDSSEN